MPGAQRTRSLVCSEKSTRVSHHGHAGNTRHSLRNGFTVSFALSPVIGLCCHRRLADTSAKLERQRRGVRTTRLRRPQPAPSSEAPSASTASHLTFVTIAKRPSERRDEASFQMIWVWRKANYFFNRTGQTNPRLASSGKSPAVARNPDYGRPAVPRCRSEGSRTAGAILPVLRHRAARLPRNDSDTPNRWNLRR
jgi:hypothetical protein